MYFEDFPDCCAAQVIGELSSVASPTDAIAYVCRYYARGNKNVSTPAFLIFTGVVNSEDEDDTPRMGYGEELRDFIARHKLGEVVESPKVLNHNNSVNWVRVWIWSPDRQALTAWLAQNPSPKKPTARSSW